MGTVDISTNPDNLDMITIDISAISTEQRRLLKKCVNYQDTIPDPENPESMIANPVPLVTTLMLDAMNSRKDQMKVILRQEGLASADATADAVLSDM